MSGSGPERDLVAEEEERLRRSGVETRQRTRGAGMDDGTRRLALTAGGLGAVLIAVVGGWTLLGHHSHGIPVLGPPPGPLRVKPTDPGGMQLMSASMAPSSVDNGTTTLAPPPEQAHPELLQQRLAAARRVEQQEAAADGDGGTTGEAPATPAPATAAQVRHAPAAAPVPAAAPAPPPPAAALPAAAQPALRPPATAATGGHSVQLAAMDSEAAAEAEWTRLGRSAPDLLRDRRPLVVPVEKDGKRFFRLRTGGFDTTADAIRFCSALRNKGIACTLADF